jgi:hypothetical protein
MKQTPELPCQHQPNVTRDRVRSPTILLQDPSELSNIKPDIITLIRCPHVSLQDGEDDG